MTSFIRSNKESQCETDASVRRKPYSFFFHPHKTWLDVFLSMILYFVFPLRKLAKLPAQKNEETMSSLKFYRGMLQSGSVHETKAVVGKWEITAGCPIVECRVKVPRRPLLQEWGVCKDDEHGDRRPLDDIVVVFRFPSAVYKDPIATLDIKNEYGCVTLDTIDFEKLDAKVPIVLSFHGGGMTMGVADMADCLDITQRACEESSSLRHIVHASVEYSLAPDAIFPIAIEEALTVASYLLEVIPKDKSIHLKGVSAGAYLATILTMELHKRFPGRVASALLLCPMMNPAADSESFYMQSESTYVDSEWLRWCWRCYLNLEDKSSTTVVNDSNKDNPMTNVSNQTLWEEWQSKHPAVLRRLACPLVMDLPTGLDCPQTAPTIIVTTNQGDPLEDDGKELVSALKHAKARVEHLSHPGSHWLGTKLDKNHYGSLIAAWKLIVFANG